MQISAGNGSSKRPLVGGELSGLTEGKYVLTSVTGTSRMAAYVTAGRSAYGLCFALGGDLPQVGNVSSDVC